MNSDSELLGLIEEFLKSEWAELDVTTDRWRLSLRRRPDGVDSQGDDELRERHESFHAPVVGPQPPVGREPKLAEPPTQAPLEPGETEIVAPTRGFFYRAPSPDVAPFVQVGSQVEPTDTLCIVEIMKLMNEIKPGVRGVVREICVENGAAVELGTRLFRIGPDVGG